MRLRVILPVLLLAGCFAPPDEQDTDPLIGLCPEWETAGTQDVSGATNGTVNLTLEPNRTRDGRAFDGADVRFTSVDGTIVVSGWNPEEGRSAILRDYRQDVGDEVQGQARLSGAGEVLLRITLHAVDRDADGGPLELRIRAEGGDASWEAEATYLYRVCAAP